MKKVSYKIAGCDPWAMNDLLIDSRSGSNGHRFVKKWNKRKLRRFCKKIDKWEVD